MLFFFFFLNNSGNTENNYVPVQFPQTPVDIYKTINHLLLLVSPLGAACHKGFRLKVSECVIYQYC